MHAAGVISFGHFLVDDAAACRHPLQVAGADGSFMPHAVAVLDCSRQHVGDCFDAAMRVPGKTCQIILRNVIAKIVQQKKWIKVGSAAEAERTTEVHACALESGLGLDQPLDGSNRHCLAPSELSCCNGVSRPVHDAKASRIGYASLHRSSPRRRVMPQNERRLERNECSFM